MAAKKRTPSGAPTQATRDKTSALGDGSFPVFDKKSAEAALNLRGHAGKPGSKAREKVIDKAAKYAPDAAKKARQADKAKK